MPHLTLKRFLNPCTNVSFVHLVRTCTPAPRLYIVCTPSSPAPSSATQCAPQSRVLPDAVHSIAMRPEEVHHCAVHAGDVHNVSHAIFYPLTPPPLTPYFEFVHRWSLKSRGCDGPSDQQEAEQSLAYNQQEVGKALLLTNRRGCLSPLNMTGVIEQEAKNWLTDPPYAKVVSSFSY